MSAPAVIPRRVGPNEPVRCPACNPLHVAGLTGGMGAKQLQRGKRQRCAVCMGTKRVTLAASERFFAEPSGLTVQQKAPPGFVRFAGKNGR